MLQRTAEVMDAIMFGMSVHLERLVGAATEAHRSGFEIARRRIEVNRKHIRQVGRRRYGKCVAAVGASLLTAATIKIVDYFKEKRAQDQQAIDTAKQEIIKGIKAYDEEQEHHDSTE